MITIVKIILVVAMCVSPVAVFMGMDSQKGTLEAEIEHIEILEKINQTTYEDYIKIEQETLQLDHEYIQYKLTFHENDSVSFKLTIKYIMIDLDYVSYHIYLTDGEKPVTEDTMLMAAQEPTGMLVDFTTPRHHLKLGGKQLIKKLRFGTDASIEDTLDVQNGTSWYITIAVQKKKAEEMSVEFKSELESMEIVELGKGSEIEYYSVLNNDFEGFYLGTKFVPILPFGISIAKNVRKEIYLHNGGIVSFYNVGQRRGTATIDEPTGNSIAKTSERGVIAYNYVGNQTGTWKFKSSGFSFPYKQVIILSYIDVNPYCKNENVKW